MHFGCDQASLKDWLQVLTAARQWEQGSGQLQARVRLWQVIDEPGKQYSDMTVGMELRGQFT